MERRSGEAVCDGDGGKRGKVDASAEQFRGLRQHDDAFNAPRVQDAGEPGGTEVVSSQPEFLRAATMTLPFHDPLQDTFSVHGNCMNNDAATLAR